MCVFARQYDMNETGRYESIDHDEDRRSMAPHVGEIVEYKFPDVK